MTGELKKYLNMSCVSPLCVQFKSYDNVLEELKKYVAQPDIKVWVGTEYTNFALYEIIKPMVCMDIFKILFFFAIFFCFQRAVRITGPVNLT